MSMGGCSCITIHRGIPEVALQGSIPVAFFMCSGKSHILCTDLSGIVTIDEAQMVKDGCVR